MKIGNPDAKGPLGPVTTARGGTPADATDFDAAKVARIAQAIADGNYRINAEVIADKLIANAKELLGKAH